MFGLVPGRLHLKSSRISMITLKSLLRNNHGRRYRGQILACYIVGSVAKGTSTEDSDVDVAIVIPEVRGKSALKYTEEFHQRYLTDSCYPQVDGKKVDFQFFYASDSEIAGYSKIPVL